VHIGLDDPLKRAEIAVVAEEHAVELTGLETGETVEVPAKREVTMPADTPPAPTPTIDVPKQLPKPVHAVFAVNAEVKPIPEHEISSLPNGAPIVFSITRARRVNLRHFRTLAAQAADHDRPLVIIANARQR
jgi:hypothetical protein